METVYNKIVSISRMNCSSLATLGTDSLELLFTLYCLFFKVLRLFYLREKSDGDLNNYNC